METLWCFARQVSVFVDSDEKLHTFESTSTTHNEFYCLNLLDYITFVFAFGAIKHSRRFGHYDSLLDEQTDTLDAVRLFP